MEEVKNEQQSLAAVTDQNDIAVPTGNVWQDRAAFDQMARVAGMLAKSTIVPASYQGNPQDCFIAVEMAARMNISPVFIMQNLYVVKGKPSWAGQACMAMINACGKFKNVRHVYTGEKGTESSDANVQVLQALTAAGIEISTVNQGAGKLNLLIGVPDEAYEEARTFNDRNTRIFIPETNPNIKA